MNYDDDCDEEENDEIVTDTGEAAVLELTKYMNSLPESVLKNLAREAARQIVNGMRNTIERSVKDLVIKECSAQIKTKAEVYMEAAFAEALVGKVLVSGTSWDEKRESIKEVIRKEMSKAVDGLKSDYKREDFIKTALNGLIDKELAQIAKAAVDEFRQKVMKDISKEAMTQIVKSVAGTIAGDKKFVALLEAMK